jgi:hypothetical protein
MILKSFNYLSEIKLVTFSRGKSKFCAAVCRLRTFIAYTMCLALAQTAKLSSLKNF